MATLTLTLTSQPFQNDPIGVEPYYTALGKALVLWGRFESHLDFLLRFSCSLPDATEFRLRTAPAAPVLYGTASRTMSAYRSWS